MVKLIRKKLNSEVDMIRIENGAYRPFKSTLSSFLSHIVSLGIKLSQLYVTVAHHGTESVHLKKLEQTICSCGVCFQIWQNREPTGKPIPGSFDWTPLSGKHKLQVLKNLPAKMDTIFEESIAPSVAKLWNVSKLTIVFSLQTYQTLSIQCT